MDDCRALSELQVFTFASSPDLTEIAFPPYQLFTSLATENLQHIQPLEQVNVIWWYTSRDRGQYLRAAMIIHSSIGEVK